MSMKEQLLQLADRVEALNGADRGVDEEIADCLNQEGNPYAYTALIDHAEMIVPRKPFPELRPGQWWWGVDNLGCDAHVAYENHDAGIPEYSASAATPALALCAAALKARADMEQC